MLPPPPSLPLPLTWSLWSRSMSSTAAWLRGMGLPFTRMTVCNRRSREKQTHD